MSESLVIEQLRLSHQAEPAARRAAAGVAGGSGPRPILSGVDLTVAPGEFVALVGSSGSGKTMTAMALATLTPFPGRVSGTIKFHGTDLDDLERREQDKLLGTELAIVFQDPMASLNPVLRIGTQMTQGVRRHRGLSREQARRAAVAALNEVKIPAAEKQLRRYPHEFSGGMRQRTMIAVGLMKQPSVLIADEPTTALDVTIQAQIMDLLGQVNENHDTAIILISHDLALISQNCHRVLVMYAGRVVEELNAKDLTTSARHPYTRALVGAVPQTGQPQDAPLVEIKGEVPDLASLPLGCPFHPRCPHAVDVCRAEPPPLLRRDAGHRIACHVANADQDFRT